MTSDQIKARLASLTKKNQKSQLLWKPKGKQVVRIVPLKSNPEDPFISLKFHYELNGKTFLSPSTFNRPDPVVEYSNKLKKSGDEELWKKGRKLEPKTRTFVPVIVRGQENEGVKFWGFGKQVYEEILSIMDEPEYIKLFDPVSGYDLTVEFKEAAELGASYPKTFVRAKPKSCPVINDVQNRELLLKITQDQPNIMDLFPEPTYEELNQALYEHLNPEAAADPEVVEPVVPAAEAELANVEPPASAIVGNKPELAEPVVEPTVVSPSATKSESKEDFNAVFAAFDNLVKKK